MRKVENVRMHYYMEQQGAAGERMFRNTGVMVGKEVQNDSLQGQGKVKVNPEFRRELKNLKALSNKVKLIFLLLALL